MEIDLKKEGAKYDKGKLRYDLIPADALDELARVYTIGSEKYDDNNWRLGMKWGKVFAAVMRHMWAFWGGEELDPEDGIAHTIHAAWGCFTLFNYSRIQKRFDDRVKHRQVDENLEYDPDDVAFKDLKEKIKKYAPSNEWGKTIRSMFSEETKKLPRVYLAGCVIEDDYRDYVADEYGELLDIFDPMKEIDNKITNITHVKYMEKTEKLDDDVISKIVEEDKLALLKSDVFVAYMERYSAGTIMEILSAWDNDIPVLIIDSKKTFRNDVWISYHTTKFFDDVDECFDFILEEGLDDL